LPFILPFFSAFNSAVSIVFFQSLYTFKLFEAAEIAKFTKEQYEAYEDSLKVYRDWKNTIETAELKAEKKGRIKGKMEEKKEMAQKMLQRGFSLDDIAAITGLSKADIDNII
jgi:predicted transposase/invertase (TIGR01784 family)